MRSLTKSGIRELTAKYRSVLKKCALLNAMVLMLGTSPSFADDVYVSSWMGLQGAIAGDANPIYVNGDITRGASDEDITISRIVSIIGYETNKYLDGGYVATTPESGYKGLTIGTGGNLTLQNITMQNFNKYGLLDNYGAAIKNSGTISIVGRFNNNYSSNNGGAIYNEGTITSITGVDDGTGHIVAFNGNSSGNVGGAIYNKSDSITQKITGDFTDNQAKQGGAIYNEGTITSITGVDDGTGNFESNQVTSFGGAIYNKAKINTLNANFNSNKSDGGGGAIYNNGEITNISGNFTNNSAKNYAGVLHNNNAASIVNFVAENRDITFSGNYVTSDTGFGGAIVNNGTVGLYAVNAGDKIEFKGTTPTEIPVGVIPKDIDGIFNQATLNINGHANVDADPTSYAGTVNLYNVSDAATAKGTTNIYGGKVDVAKDITQKAITIADGATLTTKGNVTTTDGITNAGTLNLLGGTSATRAIIASTVSGGGTTNFGNGTDNAYIQLNGAINQAMNIKEKADVETNANNIGAAVTNAGILNLIGGELVQNVTGNGSIVTKGDVTSNASNLGNTVTNTGNRLTLTGNTTTGILSKAITGTGTTVIDGTVTSSDTIAQDALTINEGKTLTASADKLDITTALTNNGTLVTDGNLNHLSTLTNNGTVQIATNKTLDVTNNYTLGGTLDLNDQILNMQEQGETPVAYSTLTVDKLKGSGQLLIDANVNETNKNADKIAYTNADSAEINLTNINVRDGFATHTTDAKDNYLTVLVNNGAGSNATFKVGGDTGKTSTQFGDYLYTFETGTTEGTLKVTEKFNSTVSLTDYITGTEKGRIIDTYSFANSETLTEAITTGSVSAEKNPYTIGMNGKDLTGSNTNNGITVSTGKTLTIDGNGGTISGFNTALINEGTLNFENVVFSGNTTDVSNAGTLSLTGENTFGSKITGTTGTVTNSGTLNIAATNLDVALTNNNILNLGEGTLGKVVTGDGTTNIESGIVNAKNSFAQNTLHNEADFNFDATGKTGSVTTLSDAETTKGTTNIKAGLFTVNGATTQKAITVTSGAELTTKDNVTTTNGIANAGTLNLLGGIPPFKGPLPIRAEINSTVTGDGTTNFGNGTNPAYIQVDKAITQAININVNADVLANAAMGTSGKKFSILSGGLLEIAAGNIKADVTNVGTLNLGAGTLAQAISGEGTTNIKDDVTSTVSIANAISIDSGKSLTIGASNVGGAVTNSGILNLGTGILEQEIKGTGTTNIDGGTVNVTGSFAQKELSVKDATLALSEKTVTASKTSPITTSVFTLDNAALNLQNNSTGVLNIGKLSLTGNNNLMLDVDLAGEKMDQINVSEMDGESTGTLNISDIKLLSATTQDKVSLDLFAEGTDSDVYSKVSGNLSGLKYSPTYIYDAKYNTDDGKITFTRTEQANPYLYAPSTMAQTTASITGQIAGLAMDKLDAAVSDSEKGLAGGDLPKANNAWVKVMGFDDDVDFKHFNTIDSKAYTLAAGFNTDKVKFDNFDAAFGVYGGYIGGRQKYTGSKIEQDGGYVGLSSELTKGNAFLLSTIDTGFINNENENMYGTDKFDTRWLGVGLKGGYNYALTDSWTLQPNVYAGYTLVNTEDYTSKSGVRVNNDNLNFFEIDPGFKLMTQIDTNWLGFIQGKYAIVMDNGGETTFNDSVLPNISAKNYFEYGFGMNKSLTDAWSLNGEINRRDGGRTGWNGSVEFKYNF